VLFFWVDGQASEILFWTIAIFMGAFLAFLSKIKYDLIVIIGTAILGAYSIIRGASLFFPDTFPPESQILKQIADGSIDPIFYSYVAAFVLTSIVGGFYQYNKMKLDAQ
jgi:multisubunit Na+/H+ antiporter MnhC subunit